MFYLKTDDIEELFREAAEKYHIDTEDAAAWDDVYEAVHGNDKPAQPSTPVGGNKKRWLNLMWLLLIPLGWFAHNVWNNLQDNKTTQQQQAYTNDTSKNTAKANSTTGATAPATGNAAVAATPPNNSGAVAAKPPVNNATAFAANNLNSSTGSKKQISISGGNKANKQMQVQPNAGSQVNSSNNNPPVSNDITAKANIPVPQNNNPVINANTSAKKEEPPVTNAQPLQNNAGADKSDIAKNDGSKAVDKKAEAKSKDGHYFYLGFIASPDVSFIHFQKTSPVGIGAGLLAGYQINKHLSVETGVLFDSKNYYTDGQYFNKGKVPYFTMHPEIVVNNLDGDCKMIEIPVNLRYTFTNKSKNNWYATAGMSSYLMGREYYDYNYTDWGVQYKGGFPYNNHIKNWFSIVNLGMGYERKLGMKTNLRVEPFIKVPVSGVGTGGMAITSTGLYIGLTRKIP